MLTRILFATLVPFVLATSLFASPEPTPPAPAQPADAFHPGDHWLDNHTVPINAHGGGILLHDGFFYWYGEHKISGEAGNDAHVGVHVYLSLQDLYNWKDESVALWVSKDPNSPIHDGCILERPKGPPTTKPPPTSSVM